jgi:hypothetical protein
VKIRFSLSRLATNGKPKWLNIWPMKDEGAESQGQLEAYYSWNVRSTLHRPLEKAWRLICAAPILNGVCSWLKMQVGPPLHCCVSG